VPAKKIDLARPNIYQYHDHLSFLKDWLVYLKKEEPGFSMRTLAVKSQLAVGYLPMCLNKSRVLSTKGLHKIVRHLRLGAQERKYLELLHLAGTTEEPDIRLRAIRDMSRLGSFREVNPNEVDVYQYLTKWYYVAIREMVGLTDFKADTKWIQKRLGGRLSLAEVEQALDFLLAKGFLLKDENGAFKLPADRQLDCNEGIFKASLGEFHRQMLHLAANAIERVPRSFRYILGHTFSVAVEDLEKVRAILKEAQRKLEDLSQATKGAAHVYHVELACFPLTRVDEGTEGEGL
jgi:uncharacterized protein (TIGR02147 family)